MFRNPRENRELPDTARVAPSTGRAPSPPPSPSTVAAMAAKTITKKATPKAKTVPLPPKQTQTTLVTKDWGGKTPANNGRNKLKPQRPANGNIMAFFKKAEDINNRIFLQERGVTPTIELDGTEEDVGWSDEVANGGNASTNDDETRYNERGGSNKKRELR